MTSDYLTFLLLTFFAGGACGVLGLLIYNKLQLRDYGQITASLLQKANQEALTIKKNTELSLKQQQMDHQRELEHQRQLERRKLQREEDRIQQREDRLEERMSLVEKKLSDLERREAVLASRKTLLDEDKQVVQKQQAQLISELERISGLSQLEARDVLLNRVTHEIKTDAANLIRRTQKEAEEEAEYRANTIVATAINRLAVSCTSETTVNTVAIPNDEMKGRIIGREGRNIRSLEQATGVNFVVDDTPGVIVLSGYDPVRMQVAKMALSELVTDGRIYPTRIEEVVEKAQGNVKKLIKQYGEDAALRAGIMNLPAEILILLGKLKFRYSYGQNVLEHSLEVCHLMGLIASEMGLDVGLAKRIGLLHDMGKAVSHEMEGSHAIIGHDLALRYGESKEVANGIGCHHYEMEATSVEASLCSAADAISASRPGARIEAVEEYLKRLKKLEAMATAFPGVEKAYAMQAGREVRVVVLPDLLDDDGTLNLARDLTKQIEEELNYPGKIKVTVIREKRVVEYAM